jgi:Hypoxia induced protein conserved region
VDISSDIFWKELDMSLLTIVIIISLVLTIAVLAIGIGSMGVGGEFDEKHSDQLMFARVGMQAATLLLLLFAIYLANT